MTSVLLLIMNDGFSFHSSTSCSDFFRVPLVNLGYIADDRLPNLKAKFSHVYEHSEFTYSAYTLIAGGSL